VREYLLDNHGLFNAGNDPGGATAMSAVFIVNVEMSPADQLLATLFAELDSFSGSCFPRDRDQLVWVYSVEKL